MKLFKRARGETSDSDETSELILSKYFIKQYEQTSRNFIRLAYVIWVSKILFFNKMVIFILVKNERRDGNLRNFNLDRSCNL